MKSTVANIFLSVLISTSISLVVGEVVVRFTGRVPITVPGKIKNEPVIYKSDAQLGWVNKPGSYQIPPYTVDGWATSVTIQENGSRKTSNFIAKDKPYKTLVFLGGSYTQGWAVSDEETFSWKLQTRFPTAQIVNYGTGGYGTYQSLLLAERVTHQYLPNTHFIYFLVDFHARRNAATVEWLRALSITAKRGHVALPYVSLNEANQLVYHQPENYLTLPLRRHSALVAFIERIYMKVKTLGREKIMDQTMQKLIIRMDRFLKSNSMGFTVVILSSASEGVSNYMDFLDKHRIATKNCNIDVTEDLRIKGEGHPNHLAHQQWAECIAPIIQESTERTRNI